MKQNTAEIIKGNNTEKISLKELSRETKLIVEEEKTESVEAQVEAKEIEMQLLQAEAAHEKKEEAERQGKETNEKITELTG